ncbi:MAG TPA: site-specific DNA-methyltransferase [Methanocella sp.]|jgi:site-specific DNA-methyltransferase (cytosine-N4-specific)
MITEHRMFFKDARDMSEVPTGSVRLTVTSPPYPMIEMWDEMFGAMNPGIKNALAAGDGRRAHALMHGELDRVWREVDRVTAASGIVCINVGDATRTVAGAFRMYNNHAPLARFFLEAGYDELPSVLWRKQSNKPNKFMGSGMLPPNAYVTLEHERICIFRKGGPRTFSGEEAVARRRSAYFREERNLWFSDLWEDLKGVQQRLEGTRSRSAAYPFEIPHRLINMYSVQGDTVLDPFLGTGTTMLAAAVSGRCSVGYEIDAGLRPAIESRLTGLTDAGNRLIGERLARHEAYVNSRLQDGGTAYLSRAYGFPVVTAQETEIVLPILKEIRLAGDKFTVTYEP